VSIPSDAEQILAALLDATPLDAAPRGLVRISAEEHKRLSRDHWEEFDRLATLASAQAKANGLTEAELQEILSKP
jgi:hypothetical protein